MKKYIFKPYSDLFPSLFNKEKERIASQLLKKASIEHVGSTAVPGLGGKGIIDIAIAVDKSDMENATAALQELGYEFRPSFSTPDVDWNIGEFFIVSKFQGKGVGRYAAEQVFNQFPGVWETSQIPENTAAIEFWDRVIRRYSHGQFEKTLKTVPEPKPHPMIILKFTSQGSP